MDWLDSLVVDKRAVLYKEHRCVVFVKITEQHGFEAFGDAVLLSYIGGPQISLVCSIVLSCSATMNT